MKGKAIFTIISIFLIVGFLSAVYLLTGKSSNVTYDEAKTISSKDQAKWSKDNKNILVEYSDFQCPACKFFHQEIQKIEASQSSDFAVTQKITYVYRHFPLSQHPNAKLAAYASEAASRQSKFYQMADLIFTKQEEWANLDNPQEFFINLAEELKLDIEKFKKDIEAKDIQEKVQEDINSGSKLGVNSTPTFYLNGKKVEITSFEEFKKLLISASSNNN